MKNKNGKGANGSCGCDGTESVVDQIALSSEDGSCCGSSPLRSSHATPRTTVDTLSDVEEFPDFWSGGVTGGDSSFTGSSTTVYETCLEMSCGHWCSLRVLLTDSGGSEEDGATSVPFPEQDGDGGGNESTNRRFAERAEVKQLVKDAIQARKDSPAPHNEPASDQSGKPGQELGPRREEGGSRQWVWVAILEYACCDDPIAWIESYVTHSPGTEHPEAGPFKPDVPFGFPELVGDPIDQELEEAIDEALDEDREMKKDRKGRDSGFFEQENEDTAIPGTGADSGNEDADVGAGNSGETGTRKKMIHGLSKITVSGEREIGEGEFEEEERPPITGPPPGFYLGQGMTPAKTGDGPGGGGGGDDGGGGPSSGGTACMIAVADAPTGENAGSSSFTVIGRCSPSRKDGVSKP